MKAKDTASGKVLIRGVDPKLLPEISRLELSEVMVKGPLYHVEIARHGGSKRSTTSGQVSANDASKQPVATICPYVAGVSCQTVTGTHHVNGV